MNKIVSIFLFFLNGSVFAFPPGQVFFHAGDCETVGATVEETNPSKPPPRRIDTSPFTYSALEMYGLVRSMSFPLETLEDIEGLFKKEKFETLNIEAAQTTLNLIKDTLRVSMGNEEAFSAQQYGKYGAPLDGRVDSILSELDSITFRTDMNFFKNSLNTLSILQDSLEKSKLKNSASDLLLQEIITIQQTIKRSLALIGQKVTILNVFDTLNIGEAKNLVEQLQKKLDQDIGLMEKGKGNASLLPHEIEKLKSQIKQLQDTKTGDVFDLHGNNAVMIYRAVNESSLEAAALEASPTKGLATKAKSGARGTIPVDQSLSKVGPTDPTLGTYQQYSLLSLMTRGSDGLPISMENAVTKLGVNKKTGAPTILVLIKNGSNVDWLEVNNLTYHHQIVTDHADPRSIKGSSSNTIQAWKKWSLKNHGLYNPTYQSPTLDSFPTTHESIALVDQNLALITEYTEFLIGHEQVSGERLGTYTNAVPITKCQIADRLRTVKNITADADPLTIATSESNLREVPIDQGSTGASTPSQLNIVTSGTAAAERRGSGQQVNHGAEEFNPHAQQLAKDYPLTLVGTDGTYRIIIKSLPPHPPHEHLFHFLRKYEKKGYAFRINPGDVISHPADYQNLSWPPKLAQYMYEHLKEYLTHERIPPALKIIMTDLKRDRANAAVLGKP